MANGRNPGRNKRDSSREPGSFVALPWSVLDSVAYARLSHPARALLLEFARQYCRDNNGRLLASRAYLGARGWKSSDVIFRAIRQLIAEGFIHQTVMGHRPNKASWYAITWYSLDKHKGYDVGVELLFKRGSYSRGTPLIPRKGTARTAIAPANGTGGQLTTPPQGAVNTVLKPCSTPSTGHHLERPSAVKGGQAELSGVLASTQFEYVEALRDTTSVAEHGTNRQAFEVKAEILSEIF
jgi:hypothetical protein